MWRWLLTALAAFSAVGLTGCGGVLAPRGPVGEAQLTIMLNSLAIMMAIVVPTIIATLAFAWWFRASNSRAIYRPDFVYSGRLELIIWSIPTLIILFLGGVIWVGSHRLDPSSPVVPGAKPLQVQVVSLDWKWLFIYPEQRIATVNELVLPVGRPVSFSITSASVMNTFFVPQLGSMIYSMNGMVTRLNLMAAQEGRMLGLSGHYSGDGYSDMLFPVHALPERAFADWASRASSANAVLDRGSYVRLAEQSINDPPAVYRLGDARLFSAIVSREVPPSAGPTKGRPIPSVSHRTGG